MGSFFRSAISRTTKPQAGPGPYTKQVNGHSVPQPVEAFSIRREDAPQGTRYSFEQVHLPVEPANWHHLPMGNYEFETAMRELEAVS